MADQEMPQIYLISPSDFELSVFAGRLSAVLDRHPVSCFRLAMASSDEDQVIRAADALRDICHARDIAMVIDAHVQLVTRLGLDGVHLGDGARQVGKLRRELGEDVIIGAYCGNSRHDGMSAGEAGADYVSFGPVSQSALGSGAIAEADLFAWWSEMIEIPVVAEGGVTALAVSELSAHADFIGIGPEIWDSDQPAERLAQILG